MDEYQRGYLDGYRDAERDQKGGITQGSRTGEDEAERLIFAELEGKGVPPEEESRYWLGYYHGRSHARTSELPEGAKDKAPAGL